MDNPYYDTVIKKMDHGRIKEAYSLFRSFEVVGQFTEKEITTLENRFDDPSLS